MKRTLLYHSASVTPAISLPHSHVSFSSSYMSSRLIRFVSYPFFYSWCHIPTSTPTHIIKTNVTNAFTSKTPLYRPLVPSYSFMTIQWLCNGARARGDLRGPWRSASGSGGGRLRAEEPVVPCNLRSFPSSSPSYISSMAQSPSPPPPLTAVIDALAKIGADGLTILILQQPNVGRAICQALRSLAHNALADVASEGQRPVVSSANFAAILSILEEAVSTGEYQAYTAAADLPCCFVSLVAQLGSHPGTSPGSVARRRLQSGRRRKQHA